MERASIDEAYLDLTKLVEKRLASGARVSPDQLPNTWLAGNKAENREETVVNWCQDARDGDGDDLRLAVGAVIMEEVRAEVFRRTEFRCSAGVAHCKTLAKLCAGHNKPNKQTVLPDAQIPALYEALPVTKVRGLGGKLGDAVVQGLEVETMAQLAAVPRSTLEAKFEAKTVAWFQLLARGRDGEVVMERELSKSIGCGKNFRGKEKLESVSRVEEKLTNLVEELLERLEEDRDEYGRMATGLTVGVAQEGIGWVSRAGPLPLYTTGSVFAVVMGILTRLNTAREKDEWSPALLNISISAGKFVTGGGSSNQSITSFFSAATSTPSNTSSQTVKQKIKEKTPSKSSIKSFFGLKMLDTQTQEETQSTPPASPKLQGSEEEAEAQEKDDDTNQICDNVETDATHTTSEAQEEFQQETDDTIVKQETQSKDDLDLVETNYGESSSSVNNCEHSSHEGDKESNTENYGDFDIAELIPSLDAYDPSLLEILPQRLREKAQERVNILREKQDSNPAVTNNVITNFLASGSQLRPEKEEENVEDNLVECEKCKQKVSAFTLPEHLDWHFAVNLSKQPNPNTLLQNTKSQSKLPTKRKRDPASKLSNNDISKKPCKENISNYFKKN